MFNVISEFTSATFFQKMSEAPEPFYYQLSASQIANLEQNLNVTNYNLDNQELYELFFKKIIVEILSLILEKNIKTNDNRPQWINTIIASFNNPYLFNQSVNEIISDLHYNMSCICRTFKKYVGSSMTNYFNSIKLEHSYMLLKTTDVSIEKILEIICYKNITHFYRDLRSISASRRAPPGNWSLPAF